MSGWAKARLLALLASASVACFAGGAKAEDVLIEPAGSVTASGTVSFSGGSLLVSCALTLTGSLSEAALPVAGGTQLGEVTGASWGSCGRSGSIRAVHDLPWPLEMQPVEGTFPEGEALGLDAIGVRLSFALLGGALTCEYGGQVGATLGLTADRELEDAWNTGGLTFAEAELVRTSGSVLCPPEATAAGTFDVAPPQQVQKRRARLSAQGSFIPSGQRVVTVTVRNGSPVRHPELRIEAVSLANEAVGDNKDVFEIPAADQRCTGRTLPPGAALACSVNVRYVGAEEARPRTVKLKIEWHDGNAARVEHHTVVAEE